MIKKYSVLAKKNTLPPATAEFLEEMKVQSGKTQIATSSYKYFDTLVKEWMSKNPNKTPKIVDIGAGRGINVDNLEKQQIPVVSVEPNPNKKLPNSFWKDRDPDYSYSSEVPSNTADLVFNSFVINVVSPDIAESIVRDIGRILKRKGQGLIFVRSISDVEKGAKPLIDPKYGEIHWGEGEMITSSRTYQKGYSFETFSELINRVAPELQVERHPAPSGIGVLVTKP